MADQKKPTPKKTTNKQDATPADHTQQNAIAVFTSILDGWGIPIGPEQQAFVQQAVKQGWSTTFFVRALRGTKFYAQEFPGIMKNDGTLRMTESQYISGYNSSKDYAASVGRHFDRQMYGLAVKNNNSPSEIKAKLEANDKMKSFKPELDSFSDYLMARGMIKKPLTKEDRLAFIMGQAPRDFENAWEAAHTATQLEQVSGFDIGKPSQGGVIGYKGLAQLVRQFQGKGGDLANFDYEGLAKLAADVLPKSALYGAGINERQLLDMAFKGKNAPDVAKRVTQVLANYQAAVTEEGAQSQNTQGKPLQGTPSQPMSE